MVVEISLKSKHDLALFIMTLYFCIYTVWMLSELLWLLVKQHFKTL